MNKEPTRLVAFGDVQPGWQPRKIFDNVQDAIDSDLTFCNLEGPVSKLGKIAIAKEASLRSDPSYLSQLVNAKIKVVSFANNHVMDYGMDAFLDTLDLLEKNRIKRAGAGKNIDEAHEPAILEVNGLRIAFLAYASFFDLVAQATDSKPGIAVVRVDPLFDPPHLNREDVARMIKDIKNAKNELDSDVVVVSHHWGTSMSETLTTYQRALARVTIDAGADLVLGTHPHILQGIEVYKGKCVFYSLGNFVFEAYPPWFNSQTKKSAIVTANISFEGVSKVGIHPVFRSDNVRPFVLSGGDEMRRVIVDDLNRMSRDLGTKINLNDGEISSVKTRKI